MKGILVDKAGGEYALVDTLEKPKPGKNQVLVKSLVTGLNPVENFQRGGVLVESWPIVLGCDASGSVVEVGEGVTKFKEGDGIFGCTRLGHPGYGTFQEYLSPPNSKPADISVEQAATIGVGLLTAGLGLFSGTKIALEPKEVTGDSEWIIIPGAAGAVGQYGVQLAKLCGYKVLASCSPSNKKLVESIGADATINYKDPLEDLLKDIKSITGGKFSRVFDASAMATEIGIQALAQCSQEERLKYFATTNGWIPIEPKEGIEIYVTALGVIGKTGDAHNTAVNNDIAAMIPKLETFLESGEIKPMEYEQIGDVGVGDVLKGLEAFNVRKTDGKKLVVRLSSDE
ncbi:hypothetical protein G7Y89_g11455 [Cudoniella acicularis]|uniref:Enoyl reductase (ER) domain-containing protein n=1 Tax=Cudoniella acicularis TaxID=354080 RepID=A0A8H4REH0_9HELO|nr:hypothetical protein G7Y89_g11455 [Cudoniella acicularis]